MNLLGKISLKQFTAITLRRIKRSEYDMTFKDKILSVFEGWSFYEKARLYYWRLRNKKRQAIINNEAKERAEGKADKRYERLKSLKNAYSGKRCFIVATGPSLTYDDLNKLKGEITFGMNSIIKTFDKTDWRPTFYGIQDRDVYGAMENLIKSTYQDSDNVFVADILSVYYDIPKSFIRFPYDGEYHLYNGKPYIPNAKFSDNAYSIVYDGYSITYSLIEIAVYMGFTEIYLLGCDCSYPKGQKNHFVESGFVDKRASLNPVRMRTGFACAKEYAQKHNIKIYNATRGGELETFTRVNLDDVL